MIAATIHDAAALSGLANGSPAERGALIDHLAHVAHSHLIVLDIEGRLGQSLQAILPHLPMGIRARLEAAIRPERVVRLPIDVHRLSNFTAVIDRADTAVALSIGNRVDAIISDQDGKACADRADDGGGRVVYTLPEFFLSPCHQRLLDTMGSVPTGGMTIAELDRLVLGPVVKWAKGVTVYDKYIATGFYQTAPERRCDNSQWGRINTTLRHVRKLWRKTSVVGQDRFRIITSPISKWGPRKYNGKATGQWQTGPAPSPDQQAIALAQALGGDDKTQVDIVSIPTRLKYADHDRYLITDRNVILSLSRGFDLISPSGSLVESNVSLYHEGAKASVSELLKMEVLASRNAGG